MAWKHVPVETTHGDPTYEEWLSDIGSSQGLVTSIDDIDPNQCNLVHNINACGPDQIGFIEVGEPRAGDLLQADSVPSGEGPEHSHHRSVRRRGRARAPVRGW